MTREEAYDRMRFVAMLRDYGWTYAQIGATIGRSNERVRQLLWHARRRLHRNG